MVERLAQERGQGVVRLRQVERVSFGEIGEENGDTAGVGDHPDPGSPHLSGAGDHDGHLIGLGGRLGDAHTE